VKILELPRSDRQALSGANLRVLAQVLFESAELLAEAREADDPGFRESATELAIRSLRTAGTVFSRQPAPRDRARRLHADVISGPWLPDC
jgi:hypothetical protein